MAHTCSAALIRCIDFRLTKGLNQWLGSQGLMNDCDIISVAGISKVIAENPESPEAKYLIQQIQLSKQLHDIKKLYILHHTDCGAYGGSHAFENAEIERAKYQTDMEKVKTVIAGVVPGVEVIMGIFDIHSDTVELI